MVDWVEVLTIKSCVAMYQSSSLRAHHAVRVSSGASVWPCAHDAYGPASPREVSFGDAMWTPTCGSTRTSPTCRVRSGDNMWNNAHLTLKFRTSHVVPRFRSPRPAAREGELRICHVALDPQKMLSVQCMWSHDLCTYRCMHSTLTSVVGGCLSTYAGSGTHYRLCHSTSTCHDAVKYHYNHVAVRQRLVR
jgi:hypothetical protein